MRSLSAKTVALLILAWIAAVLVPVGVFLQYPDVNLWLPTALLVAVIMAISVPLARWLHRNPGWFLRARDTVNEKRQLPFWLHRIFTGLLPAAVMAALGSYWIGEPADSWRHLVSLCVIWSSVPVGILCAALTHRLSIVEGLAGDVGYEKDTEKCR